MILREKNIVVDKGLAAGERGVPANEPGNNPPAWPAEGAGQGLYRLRRQGHHIADRPLAVKMAIAVDLALAHLQRGGPDLLTARPAAGVKVRQRGRDAVGLLQRFAQHDGILNRHARPLTEMRSGSVNRVAHQHDASLIPGDRRRTALPAAYRRPRRC